MTETPDQAATRRRWVTLAEVVAVAGLLIAAGTLYLNWNDRREDTATKAAEQASESRARGLVTLSGKVIDGGDALAIGDATHEFTAVRVAFPAALGLPPRDAMPGPTIRAEWFSDVLLDLTDKGADARDGRLPTVVTVTWWDGDVKRKSAARYDILWHTEGRILRGRKLKLTGLALADRDATDRALEAAWQRQKPTA